MLKRVKSFSGSPCRRTFGRDHSTLRSSLMRSSLIFAVIGAFAMCDSSTSALTILGVSTFPSPSHHIWYTTLMNGLAQQGHHVYTLGIMPVEFDEEIVSENRTGSFVFEGFLDKYQNEEDSALVLELMERSVFDMINFLYIGSEDACAEQIATNGAKEALAFVKNTTIDVIVQDLSMGQCFYSLFEVAKGDPVFVGFTPMGSPTFVKNFVGGNSWPAINHYHNAYFVPPFTLWEKTLNFIYGEYENYLRNYYYLPVEQKYGEEFIGKKLSMTLSTIEKRLSVFLVNSHASFDSGIFLPPNVVEVGGLHIREPKPLPQDIQTFLDGAEHGAIVISMGTNVKSNILGQRKLKTILSVLSRLKQRVLWKFDSDNLPNKPPNVMIKKWLPQSDVLTHPKIRVIWTHSGLLSTHEALWWGVPVIGMPFFRDQFVNIARLVKRGVALPLDFENLTTETISETINKILSDPSFAQRMKKLSQQFRDRPMSPIDLAVWHIEHSARHPELLSSPGKHLSRWDLNLLDVYTFLGTVFVSILTIFWYLFQALLRLFLKQRKVKTS